MYDAALTAVLVCAGANAAAGIWGAWRWWQVEEDRRFWVALRLAQVVAGLAALACGVLYAAGFRPGDGLFWLYVLLPIAVSVVAEQLRVLSAQTVLDARGLADAQAVGALPVDEQRSVVRAILRREMGVMALSALAVVFLALRAAGTA